MNRCRLSSAALTTALFVLMLAPAEALAWGSNGHRIVAKIGEDNLSDAARDAVRDLTHGQSLASLATWPDFIRSDKRWDCIKPWHFLTVEDDETIETSLGRPAQSSELCEKAQDGLAMPNNVVAAIDYFSAILRGDEKKARAFRELLERTEVEPYRNSLRLTALIFLVHFVGDVHQPLHVGRGGDRGGNSISVQWFGGLTNLHSVWDSALIDNEGLGFSEYATFLEQEFSDQSDGSGAAAWAQESFSSRSAVYPPPDKRNPGANLPKLSYDYAAAQNDLLKRRLYNGGRRLGHLLDSILGSARN